MSHDGHHLFFAPGFTEGSDFRLREDSPEERKIDMNCNLINAKLSDKSECIDAYCTLFIKKYI